MRQFEILRIERSGNQWFICDPQDRRTGVKVDAAVMTTIKTGRDWAEGHMLGVHGLSQEVCANFDQQIFNALGVAAQLKGFSAPPSAGTRRTHFLEGGKIEVDGAKAQ